MLRKFVPLNRATLTPGGAYDTEHTSLAYDAMLWLADATIAGAGVASPAEDAMFRMLGTPEVLQAEEPLIRVEGRTLRHLAAYSSGGYAKTLAPTGAGAGTLAEAVLDFARFLPGAFISGDVKSFVRGNYGALADYAGTPPTGLAGNLRCMVRTIPVRGAIEHTRPFYREFSIPVVAADPAQEYLITVDQDVVSAGLFLLQRDSDAGTAGGGARVDGLVRNIRVTITTKETGQETTHTYSWGQIRALTARVAGFTDLDWDQATGTAFIPFIDPESEWAGRLALHEGDTIRLTIDSSSTVEPYFTAVTPAAGDHLRVVRVDHQVVRGGMGGDAPAPQAIRAGLTTGASNGTRQRRGARRRARGIRRAARRVR